MAIPKLMLNIFIGGTRIMVYTVVPNKLKLRFFFIIGNGCCFFTPHLPYQLSKDKKLIILLFAFWIVYDVQHLRIPPPLSSRAVQKTRHTTRTRHHPPKIWTLKPKTANVARVLRCWAQRRGRTTVLPSYHVGNCPLSRAGAGQRRVWVPR